jgi:hypothetical protein
MTGNRFPYSSLRGHGGRWLYLGPLVDKRDALFIAVLLLLRLTRGVFAVGFLGLITNPLSAPT